MNVLSSCVPRTPLFNLFGVVRVAWQVFHPLLFGGAFTWFGRVRDLRSCTHRGLNLMRYGDARF